MLKFFKQLRLLEFQVSSQDVTTYSIPALCNFYAGYVNEREGG